MLCDDCKKNEAVFHSVSKFNGVTSEKHLCAECQKKYGSLSSLLGGSTPKYSGLNLNNLFSTFAGLNPFDEPEREDLICPSCGTSAEEFLRTGFVGCSDCYNTMSNVILPVIRKMQGNVAHVGKVPIGLAGNVSTEYGRLKKELDEAIAVENYEQATIIRDRMRQLKGEN